MTSKRVLVTTAYLEPGGQVDQSLRDAGFEPVFGRRTDRESSGRPLTDYVAGVSGIIAGTDAFTADVLGAASDLEIISRCGVGYDNVDVAAATRDGIAVTCTPGANRQTVAEHVLALMLSCARGIPSNVAKVRAGGWEQPSGRELAGATLGVIGLGSIGRTVAELALAIGMRVVAYDSRIDEEFLRRTGTTALGFEQLLAESDFVTVHVFLDESTRHLIGPSALQLMKPTAYLINTARGGIVDEDALTAAVQAGQLAGAALDVVETEPLPADSRLRGLDNVIVTAHIGGATEQARSRSSLLAARQVIDMLGGHQPSHLVNPEFQAAKESR